jgi:hypothetical protein
MGDGASGHKGFGIKYCELNEIDCTQYCKISGLKEVFWLDINTELGGNLRLSI